MKLAIALSLAAATVVLAGSAGAQDHGGARGEYPQMDQSSVSDYQGLPRYSNAPAQAVYRQQVKAYKMACAVDRQALCKGRTNASSAWECIRLRRSKLTEPCRQATYGVERAGADANLAYYVF
jgi:hypothetical protein